MNGFSLTEMLIVLFLLSLSILFSITTFSHFYENHEIEDFKAQLTSAIKLAQGLSLTRNDNLIICAQQQNICQKNWQGELVLMNEDNEILQRFGNTPKNLSFEYTGLSPNNMFLIKNHGLYINNGTFHITTSSHYLYEITISQQGIITYEPKRL